MDWKERGFKVHVTSSAGEVLYSNLDLADFMDLAANHPDLLYGPAVPL